jgi:hypothetical protein
MDLRRLAGGHQFLNNRNISGLREEYGLVTKMNAYHRGVP